MKKLLKTFLALTALLSTSMLSSCANDSGQLAEETNVSTERMTKHVVDITPDNFSTYVDLKKDSSYYFIGALSYAYYDNVNFRYYYEDRGQGVVSAVFSLSASGYKRVGSYIYNLSNFKFYEMSGSVIYWL